MEKARKDSVSRVSVRLTDQMIRLHATGKVRSLIDKTGEAILAVVSNGTWTYDGIVFDDSFVTRKELINECREVRKLLRELSMKTGIDFISLNPLKLVPWSHAITICPTCCGHKLVALGHPIE